MRALPYWSGSMYLLFLKLLHGNALETRYRRISELVGEGKKVFEPGCGPALLADYLRGCEYVGWDLNEKLVKSARRRGVCAEVRDATEWRSYPEVDVIVIVDFLHHIVPRHVEVLAGALRKARRVILCEPVELYRVRLPKPLRRAVDAVAGDNDGINPFEARERWDGEMERLLSEYRHRVLHTEFMEGDVIAVLRGRARTRE